MGPWGQEWGLPGPEVEGALKITEVELGRVGIAQPRAGESGWVFLCVEVCCECV